jgi:hypothetical protein
MREKANKRAGCRRHAGQRSKRGAAEGLCDVFSHTSALGFAVLDDELRYQSVSDALAAINGFPAAAHLGNSIRDMFGDEVAGQIEPAVKRLAVTGNALSLELNATLPSRNEPGWFIDHYFPIEGAAGRVTRIGLVVVDVTQQRKLDAYISRLAGDLLQGQERDDWYMARELHDSIDEYHAALETSLESLTRSLDAYPDVLAEAVERLEQRILSMRELVNAVASAFPIDGKRKP